MEKEEIRDYLREAVQNWRQHRDKCQPPTTFKEVTAGWSQDEYMAFIAPLYVDAFQSVHSSIFGKPLEE
jgi:hypothetical protein